MQHHGGATPRHRLITRILGMLATPPPPPRRHFSKHWGYR